MSDDYPSFGRNTRGAATVRRVSLVARQSPVRAARERERAVPCQGGQRERERAVLCEGGQRERERELSPVRAARERERAVPCDGGRDS